MPGSHKSNIIHPAMSSGGGKIEYDSTDQTAVDAFGSARAVFQKAGDVLLFVDCCVHGSAPREAQDGQRRFVLYRYGPSWANSRYGYPPSVELLQRLTPEQRKIMYLRPLTTLKKASNADHISVRSQTTDCTTPSTRRRANSIRGYRCCVASKWFRSATDHCARRGLRHPSSICRKAVENRGHRI